MNISPKSLIWGWAPNIESKFEEPTRPVADRMTALCTDDGNESEWICGQLQILLDDWDSVAQVVVLTVTLRIRNRKCMVQVMAPLYPRKKTLMTVMSSKYACLHAIRDTTVYDCSYNHTHNDCTHSHSTVVCLINDARKVSNCEQMKQVSKVKLI
jgi:hypothetical protein